SAWSDTWNEAVLTLQILGNVQLLEDDESVKEGKGHHHDEVQQPVGPACTCIEGVVDGSRDGRDNRIFVADKVARDRPRENEHARGEDKRDHPRRIDLERNMGCSSTVDAVAADLLGDLDR